MPMWGFVPCVECGRGGNGEVIKDMIGCDHCGNPMRAYPRAIGQKLMDAEMKRINDGVAREMRKSPLFRAIHEAKHP